MNNSEAISIVKGHTPDCSKEEITKAWQYLVDNGAVWDLGKKFSLMASCMIAAGTLERNGA